MTLSIVHPPAVGPATKESAADAYRSRDGLEWDAKKVVVVIDDEECIRDIVVRLLEDSGLTALSYGDPLEVLERAQRQEPIDIVITDVLMPSMTGQELQKELVRRLPSVETIFMSGHTERVVAEEASHLGEVIFLPKPFGKHSLFAALDHALNRLEAHSA